MMMMMLGAWGEEPKITMYPYCTGCIVLYK